MSKFVLGQQIWPIISTYSEIEVNLLLLTGRLARSQNWSKCVGGRGSTPHPTEGAYNAPTNW